MNQAVDEYFTSKSTCKFTTSLQTESKTFQNISTISDIYSYLNTVKIYKYYILYKNGLGLLSQNLLWMG